MTAELILAIAMLCQTQSSSYATGVSETDKYQLQCQQYYVGCVDTKRGAVSVSSYPRLLAECIKERKP